MIEINVKRRYEDQGIFLNKPNTTYTPLEFNAEIIMSHINNTNENHLYKQLMTDSAQPESI